MPLKGDLCHTNGGIYGQKLSMIELNFHEKLQKESISNETNMEVIRRVISFNHLAATSYQGVQWFTCLLLVFKVLLNRSCLNHANIQSRTTIAITTRQPPSISFQ